MPFEYPGELRERLFKIWAFEADRKAGRTVDLARESDLAGEFDLSQLDRRTVNRWALDESWSDRANREVFAEARNLRFGTESTLALSAPQAAEVLRRASQMEWWVEKPHLIKNADGSTEVVMVREFDVNIMRTAVQASQLVLDRTGFSPVGTRDVGQLSAPPEMQVNYASELSTVVAIEDAGERLRAMADLEQRIRRGGQALESGHGNARHNGRARTG